MKLLMVDVGGTNVKMMTSCEGEVRDYAVWGKPYGK